ncbi:TlpA disulfide reductase family protein [Costertonia aggregata]|uniref:AhpC/TSA family protein n=1 Tax=Costertonia aggregata TaxID=343403 RepID=A0A7H9AU21_9FLAO|nr:TlpA disulfide reductase family protein [Costertonia aggregata]QLG46991.1 AhpC/TSA family protein [Costertonia aggregata]
MKKIIASVIVVLTLVACNSNPDGFTINATITGELEDGTKVYLKKPDESGQPMDLDTTTVEKGRFSFNGTADVPEMQYVFIDKVEGYIPVIIEKGNIEITAQKDSLAFAKREGSLQNEVFDDYMGDSRELSQKAMTINDDMRKANASGNKDVMKSLQEEYSELQEEFKNFEIDYIKNHPDALISVLLVNKALRSKALPEEEVSELYDGLSEEMKQTAVAKEVNEILTKNKATNIGAKAPNFTAPTPSGEEIALNEVMGKATIIDFWAAWCKPCRAENPNIVNIYNKYHEKGLNIIGVSLDRTAEAWKKAIEEDGLEWNHVSHVEYFNDPIAKLYNVQAIPAAFILDENGVIVAKNLRGQELEGKIAEMLQ